MNDVNEAAYRCYTMARERGVLISGPMLQEEARIVAERLNVENFKASNGWLESFKKRHNIKQFVASGEAGGVSEETVRSWHERLPSLLRGYEAKDIWNLTKRGYSTGLYRKEVWHKKLSNVAEERRRRNA